MHFEPQKRCAPRVRLAPWITLYVCASAFSLEAQTQWALVEQVIPGSDGEDFDSCFIMAPRVLRDEANGDYKLFYLGGGPTLQGPSILSWASSDTLTGPWERSEQPVLVGAPQLGEEFLDTEFIAMPDGGFFGYMTIQSPGGVGDVHLAVTDDLQNQWNWSMDAPLFAAGLPWEDTWVGSFSHVLAGGEHHVWYWAGGDPVHTWRLGYARSVDGLEWMRHPEPVTSSAGSAMGHPRVIYHEDSASFEMWYAAVPGGGQRWSLGYATSLDGLHWTRQGSSYDPVLGNPRQPFVIYDPEQRLYHLWFDEFLLGCQPADAGGIWYATSPWTRPRASFVITGLGEATPVGTPATLDLGAEITVDAALSMSPEPNGIVLYAWDFGDGQTTMGNMAKYVYTKPGNYELALTVTDTAGNVGRVARRVRVLLSVDDPSFRRGDTNSDGKHDLTDGVYILNHLFLGREAPPCEDAADANNSGVVDIADATYLFAHLFLGGAEPPAPFPDCGVDLLPDALGCNVGCP